MGCLTTYAKEKVTNHILGISSWTMPEHTWLGIFTTNPTVSGAGGTEVSSSGTAYARKHIEFDAWAAGVADNTSDITFDKATAPWGSCGFWVLYDAVAGNPLMYGPFSGGAKTIGTNDTLSIEAGDMDVAAS